MRKNRAPFRRDRVMMAGTATLLVCMISAEASADLVIYGIDDVGSRHSQMFELNVTTGQSRTIGPQYNNLDIEALAFMGDSIVGASGDNNNDHKLLSLDFGDGSYTELAEFTFSRSREIEGMATTGDGTVWAVIEGMGLATIDSDGSHSLKISTSTGFEGLAARSDGSMLYGSHGSKLYSIDTNSGSISQIANLSSQINGREIENLEMMSDGKLAFFTHKSNATRFSTYDLATGDLETTDLGNLGIGDIEAFVFAPVPTPGMAVFLATAGFLAGRNRRRRH